MSDAPAEQDEQPPAWAVDYFQDCRVLLGVDDGWHLWLAFVDNPCASEAEPDAKDDADGVCVLEPRYLKATIKVRRGMDDDRTRHVIMHELLHIVFAPLTVASDRVRDLLPERLMEHAEALYHDAMEQSIERLVRALQRTVKPSAVQDKEG